MQTTVSHTESITWHSKIFTQLLSCWLLIIFSRAQDSAYSDNQQHSAICATKCHMWLG